MSASEPPLDPPPVSRALTALGVPHRVFRHPGPVTTLEQAAAERGQQPEQVIRSIVFRVGAGEFVMVLVAGAQQVAWKALRQYLGQNRLTTASEAELLAATGYVPGSVGPLGLPAPMRILIDARALAPDEVSVGSGVRGTTVIFTSADLRRALPAA
jgi:Cys-tRNA(Pro) deacylase